MDALLEALLAPLFHLLGKAAEALFTAILEPLLALLAHVLMSVLCYLVALPLLCIVLTPVVLISALSGPGAYGDKVVVGYKTLILNISAGGCWW